MSPSLNRTEFHELPDGLQSDGTPARHWGEVPVAHELGYKFEAVFSEDGSQEWLPLPSQLEYMNCHAERKGIACYIALALAIEQWLKSNTKPTKRFKNINLHLSKEECSVPSLWWLQAKRIANNIFVESIRNKGENEMPEPSSDSVAVEAGVKTGNGAKAEPARINMEFRGPMRSSSDQLNDKLGGFDPPSAEVIGTPFGQSPSQAKDPTGESK